MKRMSYKLASLFIFLLAMQGVHAQQGSGAINGNLIDNNGQVISGIDTPVFFTSTQSNERYASETVAGRYSLSGLPAGTYDLNFPGFGAMYTAYSQEGIEIRAGETLDLDLNIDWGINLGTIGDDPGMLANDMRANSGDVSGPAPRRADGKPDFSGMWVNIRDPERRRGDIPHQPWAAQMFQELQALDQQNPGAYCMPQSAVPTTVNFPWKLVHADDVLVQLIEFVTPGFRQIFLDGREMPEIWNPSWYGHSTGHWEGDTLVVVSQGFNELTPGFGIHTEALKVTERYSRPEFGRLVIEITAEDPEAYTEPYSRRFEAGLVTDQEILEYICAEGNDPTRYNYPFWRGRP